MFLFDTNVIINAVSGKNPDAIFLKKAIENNKVALSVITIGEFFTRASKEEEKAFNKLTAVFPVLTIDEESVRTAAGYRKVSLKKKRVTLLDCFIAAQAKLNSLTLVTNNRADFPMKDVKIISPRFK